MTILNDFLAAHPEHIAGHRRFEVDGDPDDFLDSQAFGAFIVWVVEERGVAPARARAVWAGLKERFPESGLGPCPV
jgi:hypothetical protein